MGDTTDRAKIITICGDAKLCGDTEVSVETKSRLEKYFHTARELTLQGDLVILPYANIYGDIHKISALQLVKSNAANTQAISISDGIYDIETKENNNSEGKTKIRDRAKIITVCGERESTIEEYLLAAWKLTLLGYIVLMPYAFTLDNRGAILGEQWQKIKAAYYQAISMSVAIYVINTKGYREEGEEIERIKAYALDAGISIYNMYVYCDTMCENNCGSKDCRGLDYSVAKTGQNNSTNFLECPFYEDPDD